MMYEAAAVTIIVLVAGVGILSYLYESLDRVERNEWQDRMRALENAVRSIRTRKIK